jgi:hypothetical protein
VVDAHTKIAAGGGVPAAEVTSVDRRRYKLIDLLRADLKLTAPPAKGDDRDAPSRSDHSL